MKSIRALLFLLPLLSVAQTKTDFNSQLNNLPFVSVMASPFSAKGDCVTDDTAALQSALDTSRFIWLPKPPGGCYLVSRTLILKAGDYLYGASANNPNPGDPNQGVVIRLAPNSNVSLLQTFNSQDLQGGGNEFMAVENVVFDGNGSNQTQELQGQALVDYRGTFIQTFLRHVLITNAFGTGLFTGSTELDNVWIIGCST
ncbi:MAG: glycoside hydrolase family 55 protein, partial [Acidobacteriota bacterium]|nr:glycoside hydrolase family 55 protein [Acidobacteriota bacterium]